MMNIFRLEAWCRYGLIVLISLRSDGNRCILLHQGIVSGLRFCLKISDQSGRVWSRYDRSGSYFESRSWSRLKNKNQSLVEKFQSNLAGKIFIRVWLQKVKLILSSIDPDDTTTTCTQGRFFHQRLPENFQSKSAKFFSIKAWWKNKNQSLIDPDRFFDRDHDRDWIFPGREIPPLFF